MSGLSVAITGTTTFFGDDLLRALDDDGRVSRIVALDSKPPSLESEKLVWRKLDLIHPRAPETLTRDLVENPCDVLVHTAILARPNHKGGWAHELEAIGTRHVLVAAEAVALPKLIIRSTTLCYGARSSNPNYLPESAPLEGAAQGGFIADKVEVEKQAARYAQKNPERRVTLLRFAPLVGPRCDTLISTLLSRRIVPTLLGFDPLMQATHEEDAIGATVAAIFTDVQGAVNVAAPGVLPLSRVIKLAGAQTMPLPRSVIDRTIRALWATRLGDFPPEQIDFLKYMCVADLKRLERDLKYQPRFDMTNAIRAFRAVKGAAQAA